MLTISRARFFAVGGNDNPAQNGQPYGGINWKNEKFEELMRQAAIEPDPQKRVDLYAQAEQILVWDDAAIIPIYWYTRPQLTKPYVTRTYSLIGNEYFEKWDINP
jgi:oligopeptide transport system substrate-binding protein